MKLFIIILIILKSFLLPKKDTVKSPFVDNKQLCDRVVGVCHPQTNFSSDYVFDKELYLFNCDTLAQVKFWRQIMNLNRDSALVSIGKTRKVIHKIHLKTWDLLNDTIKEQYKDSLRLSLGLSDSTSLLITNGKSYFYNFDNAFNNFHQGINAFIDNGVDPWYAQAILLIESPNKLQKSNAGAYGSFQLMKDVARLFGLKVNKQIDERADFKRSAYAASSLIKTICIPKTKSILDSLGLSYKEDELWFRLLVMHAYHAGAGNLRPALYAVNQKQAGMGLVYQLWQTETKRFKSASQNYSQLVLAAMIEMDERIKVKDTYTFFRE